MYQRVIPRDLFNEAKLLKCLGQLALAVHDGMAGNLRCENDGDGFQIDQRQEDGGLYVSAGIGFWVNSKTPVDALELWTAYNNKRPYPLWCRGEDEDIAVFNDDGTFTDEFKEYIGA